MISVSARAFVSGTHKEHNHGTHAMLASCRFRSSRSHCERDVRVSRFTMQAFVKGKSGNARSVCMKRVCMRGVCMQECACKSVSMQECVHARV